MFINLSNHPFNCWRDNQLEVAMQYGELIDLPFPNISPVCSTEEVLILAKGYSSRCLNMFREKRTTTNVVHVAGELLFCYYVIQELLAHDVTVVTSASEREVSIDEKGVKRSEFHFTQFREFRHIV